MAGYVKIWTNMKSDEAFLALSAIQRGIFLQCILTCKTQDDNGYVRYRNMSAAGSDWGCERRTAGKSLGKIRDFSLVEFSISENGTLVIFIPNYVKWQEFTAKEVASNSRQKTGKIPEKSRLLNQTRPDQSRPEQKDKSERKKIKEDEDSRIKAFVDAFHESCPDLPKIRTVTDPRRKLYLDRLKKQPDLKIWKQFFVERIHKSDYLSGRVKDWLADLDWKT